MDILHPTPEEMTAALLEAAQAERWNHWRHELEHWTLDKAQIPPMTFPKATRNGLKSQEKPTFIQFSASFIALESFREG